MAVRPVFKKESEFLSVTQRPRGRLTSLQESPQNFRFDISRTEAYTELNLAGWKLPILRRSVPEAHISTHHRKLDGLGLLWREEHLLEPAQNLNRGVAGNAVPWQRYVKLDDLFAVDITRIRYLHKYDGNFCS